MRFILAFIASIPLFASQDAVEPPKSFTREVLQPLGMPTVSAYHKIRGSSFLNMHRIDAKGIEALGDFFLAPSRYLFCGQDIFVEGNGCQTLPSFHYTRLDWLKTTLSIIALPFAEIIGTALKALSWLSPETRHHYRIINHSLHDQSIISHIQDYVKMGIEQLHSNEQAPCLRHKRPSILSKTHQLEIVALKEVCKLLDEHGIVHWLDCGTCLGAYRYGGMIPWDDDVDLSILSPDHDNIKKILSKLDPEEFQVQDWSSYRYPKTFLKLYIKKTKTLIDIYHYNLDAATQTTTYFYSYKDSAFPHSWKKFEEVMVSPLPYNVIFPLKRTNFDGVLTWVPNQITTFLQSKYGENLDPTMVWEEASQSYHKVKDHPYWKLFEE